MRKRAELKKIRYLKGLGLLWEKKFFGGLLVFLCPLQ
jgi:hypothetical protein